jgi:hypothetical protein
MRPWQGQLGVTRWDPPDQRSPSRWKKSWGDRPWGAHCEADLRPLASSHGGAMKL